MTYLGRIEWVPADQVRRERRRIAAQLGKRVADPIRLGVSAGVLMEHSPNRRRSNRQYYPSIELDRLRVLASLLRQGITDPPRLRWHTWWVAGLPLDRMDFWHRDLVQTLEYDLERFNRFRDSITANTNTATRGRLDGLCLAEIKRRAESHLRRLAPGKEAQVQAATLAHFYAAGLGVLDRYDDEQRPALSADGLIRSSDLDTFQELTGLSIIDVERAPWIPALSAALEGLRLWRLNDRAHLAHLHGLRAQLQSEARPGRFLDEVTLMADVNEMHQRANEVAFILGWWARVNFMTEA